MIVLNKNVEKLKVNCCWKWIGADKITEDLCEKTCYLTFSWNLFYEVIWDIQSYHKAKILKF